MFCLGLGNVSDLVNFVLAIGSNSTISFNLPFVEFPPKIYIFPFDGKNTEEVPDLTLGRLTEVRFVNVFVPGLCSSIE